jgi:hypothetical protein
MTLPLESLFTPLNALFLSRFSTPESCLTQFRFDANGPLTSEDLGGGPLAASGSSNPALVRRLIGQLSRRLVQDLGDGMHAMLTDRLILDDRAAEDVRCEPACWYENDKNADWSAHTFTVTAAVDPAERPIMWRLGERLPSMNEGRPRNPGRRPQRPSSADRRVNSVPVATPRIEVSFEYCLVRLGRLGGLPRVDSPGQGRRALASASRLMVGLVAVRRVHIAAAWFPTDAAVLADASSWGPFLLTDCDEHGVGHPGLQIGGWLLEAFPDRLADVADS